MRSSVKFRNSLRVIAIAGAIGALSAAGATTAHAAEEAPTVAVTVTPSTGLADGQEVTVTGTGFQPSEAVFAFQCGSVNGQSGCTPNPTQARTDENGTVATPFTVRTSFVGFNDNGEPVGTIDCTTGPGACGIGVAADAERYASAAISFG